MAQLVSVLNTADSPFCYMSPEVWSDVRARRRLRADVPLDDQATNRHKAQRVRDGFATLRRTLAEARPDVLVIFGDDQQECFDFTNFPAFGIFVGDRFQGDEPNGENSGQRFLGGDVHPAPTRPVKGHRELAVQILTGTMKRGFDPAFMMDMPKADHGLGHAFMNPAGSLTDLNIPIIPILVNCYYAPQVTAMRCYEFGRALREVIDEHPGDLRVAVIGSGGLWHTPGAPGAWLNEEFDRRLLDCMEAGDARRMAEHFDSYIPAEGDTSQDVSERARQSTGMPSSSGPQGGTRESCNWIAAAAVADGSRATIVDYIPIYASPIGAAFAYWPNPQVREQR
jgi:hypothetical protein